VVIRLPGNQPVGNQGGGPPVKRVNQTESDGEGEAGAGAGGGNAAVGGVGLNPGLYPEEPDGQGEGGPENGADLI
jgi:hypothetical protein